MGVLASSVEAFSQGPLRMTDRRRAVITGLGVVAPNGIGKEAFWGNLVSGKSAVDWISAFDAAQYPCQVAAEVRDFRPTDFMRPRRTKYAGRFSLFAVAAARLAVEDARLDPTSEGPERIAVCLGTAINGFGDVYEAARVGFERAGYGGIPNMGSTEFAAHAPVVHVSEELGLRGGAVTIASACSTGLDVIQWARNRIQEGTADIVLAGSTEAPLSEFCFASLCAVGVLSTFSDPAPRAARPYDRRRQGLVLGEGSTVYVIEELRHALNRGATIYAEVLGFGSGNGGTLATKGSSGQHALARAISQALVDADVVPESIDYINAHGNAMPDYDVIETRAFHESFGARAYSIPISSIKSMIGHAMGAAASFQVAATALTISRSVIPPTINYEFPDPRCDLDYVPNKARFSRVKLALINAHAVGETHSVVILGAPDRLG